MRQQILSHDRIGMKIKESIIALTKSIIQVLLIISMQFDKKSCLAQQALDILLWVIHQPSICLAFGDIQIEIIIWWTSVFFNPHELVQSPSSIVMIGIYILAFTLGI